MRLRGPIAGTLTLLVAAAFVALAGEDAVAPNSVTVRVRVVTDDAKRQPVRGAKIVIRDRDTDLVAGRTGEDGVVALSVAWSPELVIEASGGGRGLVVADVPWSYQGTGLDRTPSGATDAEIRLPAGAPLRGRVLDAQTGKGVAGARVCVSREPAGGVGGQGGYPEARLGRVVTSDDGSFVFEGYALGDPDRFWNQQFLVRAPGYVGVRRPVLRDAVRRGDVGTFRLEPCGTIRGRLLHRDGTPIAGARVGLDSALLWSPDGDRCDLHCGGSTEKALAARTDAKGAFEFPHAAFGVRYSTQAWDQPGGSGHLVPDDAVSGLRVTRESATAEVVLRPADEVVDAPVSLFVGVSAASAHATVDGVYAALSTLGSAGDIVSSRGNPLRFCGVPPGRYRLRVTAKNLPDWTGEVEVDARRSPSRANVVVGGSESIAGRVVDDTGAPVAGASVRWHEEGGPSWLSSWRGDAGTTDATGAFRVVGLTKGRYRFGAVDSNRARTEIVTVAAPAAGVRIVAPRTGSLRVRLVAPKGGEIPTWAWAATGDARVAGDVLTATHIAIGHRALDFQLRGDSGNQPCYLPLHLEADVKPGETTDLGAVTLDRGVEVSGVVVGPDGRPIADAWVRSDGPPTLTEATGRFKLSPLPRERVTLVVSQDRFVAQVVVDAGAPPKDLVLRLVEARLVRVQTGGASVWPRPPYSLGVAARGATRGAFPRPLPQMDDNVTHGSVDSRGVGVIPLPPGEWTISAINSLGDVLATTDITVPATGAGPVRVSLPAK